MTARPYSPDWCNAPTMAYLLSMSETVFRGHVRAGTLPPPVEIGGKSLWNKFKVYDALEKMARGGTIPDGPDPILEAARGKKAKEHGEAA